MAMCSIIEQKRHDIALFLHLVKTLIYPEFYPLPTRRNCLNAENAVIYQWEN